MCSYVGGRGTALSNCGVLLPLFQNILALNIVQNVRICARQRKFLRAVLVKINLSVEIHIKLIEIFAWIVFNKHNFKIKTQTGCFVVSLKHSSGKSFKI